MTLYILAEDTVGNSAQTSQIVLVAGSPDSGADDVAGGGSFFSSFEFMASAVAAISILGIAFVLVTRGKQDRTVKASSSHDVLRTGRKSRASSVTHSYESSQDVMPDRRPVFSAEGIGHSQRSGLSMGGERVSVLDALSILPVDPPTAVAHSESEEEPDYVQQLEKVLNLALISRAPVVRDTYDDSPMHEDMFREQPVSDDGPMRISGLKLKKMMERDH
jgi:hypothetical protein